MKKLLVIGHTFPEPATTAAGTRMLQLLDIFVEMAYEITFATTASRSEWSVNLDDRATTVYTIQLNDPSFDLFIQELHPNIVLFDRFITEEQFGWRVAEHCPDALRILDTEDLHFLRKARELAVRSNKTAEQAYFYTETAKREIASILRSDLSLIISEIELRLLINTFRLPEGLLHYLPFLPELPSEDQIDQLPAYEERQDFVTFGNLQHAPNVDAIYWLKEEIWPKIRLQLPEAKFHIYGQYASQSVVQLNALNEGFLIKGWTPNVDSVMRKARLCLAPLRFGAGLKGKLIDAMRWGTPSVTTHIGAEGICGTLPYPGVVADRAEEITEKAVELYADEPLWRSAQMNGFSILQERFSKSLFTEEFFKVVHNLSEGLTAHRNSHFLGQVLQHHSLMATRYLSKWISEKNKK